jgi:hypothetical protein
VTRGHLFRNDGRSQAERTAWTWEVAVRRSKGRVRAAVFELGGGERRISVPFSRDNGAKSRENGAFLAKNDVFVTKFFGDPLWRCGIIEFPGLFGAEQGSTGTTEISSWAIIHLNMHMYRCVCRRPKSIAQTRSDQSPFPFRCVAPRDTRRAREALAVAMLHGDARCGRRPLKFAAALPSRRSEREKAVAR